MEVFDEVMNRKGSYCTQWDYVKDRFGQADLLPFTISDTDFAVPNEVLQAIQQRLQHPIFGYTRWNHAHFKQAVSAWFQERFDCEIEEEWILYSPSVIYSISQLIQLKSSPKDAVVVQTPAYDAFFKVVQENDRELIENPLDYQAGTYQINFADLEEKLARPTSKILLLCSPHNPTGRVWRPAELEQIIDLCQKYGVFIISDEIHMDIVRAGLKHHPILQITQKDVALVTSATKSFNFPGLIFSYLLLPDERLRDSFMLHLKNRDGLSSCSILGMEATIAAYQAKAWLKQLNAYLDENISFVQRYLGRELPQIKPVKLEGTYLLWLDVAQLGLAMSDLQRHCVKVGKVAIMDGGIYGGNGANFLRLNIGCPRQKLEQGLKGLVKAVQSALQEKNKI